MATTCFGVVLGLLACATADPARAALMADLTPPANSVPANEAVQFTFTFQDADGNVFAAVPVSVSTSLAGVTFTPSSGTTSESGEFTTRVLATTPGSAPITATVGGVTAVVLPSFAVCALDVLSVPGTFSGSVDVGQCYSESGTSNALFGFSHAASGAIAFSLTSPFLATVAVTTAVPGDHIIVDASDTQDIEWLLPVGNYQARVGAGQAGGGFSLSVVPASGTSGCVQRYLATGVTLVGQTLAASDCDFGDGSQFDSFGIYSTSPCTIRLQSSEFTPWLWLYDQDTFQINGATGFEPGGEAVLGLSGCRYANGPVFIWVNSSEDEVGGSYTLSVVLSGASASVSTPDTVRIIRGRATPRAATSLAAIRAMRARVRGVATSRGGR